jgi:Family of unknown function (DUF6127)
VPGRFCFMSQSLPQATLAALMAQAVQDGADPLTLRALVEEASETGARRALARLGLEDAAALTDMHELRTLLEAWRDVKKTARRSAIGWLVKLMLAGLLFGAMLKLQLITLKF